MPSSALPSQAFLAAVPADSREAPSPGREPRQGVVGRGCKDLYTVSETVAEATGQGGRRQRLKRRLGVCHAAPAGWNPTDRWTTARLCERGSRTLSGPCFGTFLEPLAGARHRPREIPGTYEVEAGGIEPPSEGASTSASTCVACVLISPRSLPQARSRAASRRLISAPAPPALAGAQPEVWRSSPPYGRRQVERGGLIRQPVRSFRLQLSSPARIAG